MFLASVLLIGGDDVLRRRAAEVVNSKKHLSLKHEPDVDLGIAYADNGEVALAIVYLERLQDAANVARFLFEMAMPDRSIPTIVVSEQMDAEVNLSFLRMGALECLGRPLNLSRFSLLLDMFASRERIAKRAEKTSRSPEFLPGSSEDDTFIFGSPGMRQLIEQVRLVAPLATTVLLTGETGTGKTHLSQAIHHMSPRRTKPFLAVQCGALSPTLIESEMFGHVRGAFTSAEREHAGKFARAKDGTLLLDDVDALPPQLQVKFLRSVEEREFEPVGSDHTCPLRARLIVATNRSLEDEVAAGRFRADLFYRLNVVSISIPPLRERPDECRYLVEKFGALFAKLHGRPAPLLPEPVMRAMEAYDWPGNVRELRNVVERTVVLSDGSSLNMAALPDELSRLAAAGNGGAATKTAGPENSLAEARRGAERNTLVTVLRKNHNNRTKTAAELGISRVALYKKLRKHNLS